MATQSNLPAEQTRANPLTVLRQNLTQMAPELKMALPAHVSVDKFSRVAMTAIQNNPDLVNADRKSLFGAIVRLAQDGLLPDGREAALVMFGGKAQAMPMIAGILKKVRQSGDVAKVSAQVVYENDEFVWHLGFDEDVTHNPPPLDKPRGNPIGAYATAVLKDGSRLLEVMSHEEIEKVRAVSRAKGNGPWVSWWGEMARKTVMRRLAKRLPMSTDLIDELDRDPTMEPEQPASAEIIDLQTAPEGGSRLDRLEAQIVTDVQEGPGDEDRGEAPTLDEAKRKVDECEIVADVNACVSSYAGQLSDEDESELRSHAMDRIAALKKKA
jgi:recombination protein RecT